MIARVLVLGLALSGCYSVHERQTPDPCIDAPPTGCLLDRPCWCWISYDDGSNTTGLAWCYTCLAACPDPDLCECRSVGGGPAQPGDCR